MLRGYRLVILAVAGLALIGAGQPPKGSNESQDTQTAAEIKRAANSISTAIFQAAKPIEQDRGCKKGQDARNSDLCAQWKAADAATDAANYAWWTICISFLGTCLLIWTLWETREASRKELRAYVKIEVQDAPLILKIGEPIKIGLKITNYGHTPARNATHQFICIFSEYDWEWPHGEFTSRLKGAAITLHRDHPFICYITTQFDYTDVMSKGIGSGQFIIFVKAALYYDDVFGKMRMTQVSIDITAKTLADGVIKFSPSGNCST